MNSEGLAIDDARPSTEIARQGPEIQPLIQTPRISRNHAGTVGAYVFGEALLRGMADIEAAEIDSYGQGNALFQSASDGLHGTPSFFRKIGWWVSEEGTTETSYPLREPDSREIPDPEDDRGAETHDSASLLTNQIQVVPPAYRRLHKQT